jgi:N-acetylglucosaminyl-diphospho-decaprenol L-rhamnosyltransferase
MSRPGVAIIVVSCNSGPLLLDCVRHALAQEPCRELLLVDNFSEDGWVERASEEFAGDARFRCIRNQANLGFGAACNQGARASAAPLLLFLNPDCLLPAGALEQLGAHLAQDARIGLIGAAIVDADGRDEPAARRRFPSLRRLIHSNLSRLGNPAEQISLPADTQALQAVDACSGALMLLPRSVFEACEGFESDYFLHGEDLELCAKVHAQGRRVVVANRVRVVHRKGSSSRSRPVFVAWHKHRGLWRFMTRNGAPSGWHRMLLALGLSLNFVFLSLPVAVAQAFWQGRKKP